VTENIDTCRRRLVGTAAITLAGTQFAWSGAADAGAKAKPAIARTTKVGTHTSFASLKQIDAGVINVRCGGRSEGPPVILLHGWF
jgi:hypothetical protein